MIIDIVQKPNGIEISYIDRSGKMVVGDYEVCKVAHHYPVWYVNGGATRFPDVKDVYGRSVDLKRADRFNRFDLMQYMSKLPEGTLADMHCLYAPTMSAFDIETLIGDEFPDPAKAAMPIVSISNTVDDGNLTTAVFTTHAFDPDDCGVIVNIVNDYLKPLKLERPVDVRMVYMPSERQMLETWLGQLVVNLHAITGWNINNFDLPYIKNRCRKLGVNMALGSVRGSVDRTGMPTHKIIEDMMGLMKTNERSLGPVTSYSLDNVANKVLGLGKLYYESDLKTLYETDKPRFLAYNAIDTLLPILMHRKKETINTKYALASLSGLPFKDVHSAINLSESVCMKYLLDTYHGKIVIADGSQGGEVGSYEGGYVKQPIKGVVNNVACYDVSSQYPSAMRTFNLSPENFVKTLTNSKDIDKYKADPNYIVTVRDNLYNNTTDSIYRAVLDGLYKKRQAAKKEQFKYLMHKEVFDAELRKREKEAKKS